MGRVFMSEAPFEVCVVGGGPAGSATALHLRKLGHRVCLVERSRFPRAHVGESLTKGIWPIFETLGVRELFLRGGFPNARETLIRWTGPQTERLAHGQVGSSLLVDRGSFDMVLLDAAATSGVRVFQPAQARRASRTRSSWRVEFAIAGNTQAVTADYLVDATGRSSFFRSKRSRISPPTVALCGYLHGRDSPRETLVEALPDGWCWGAPIPGGLFSAMVFLDPAGLRHLRPGLLEAAWRSRLADTGLFADLSALPLARPVFARDATTYYATEPIGPDFVKVGEASFSLDPMSSTGVEKSMQSGIIAAIALHTMILWPDRTSLCERFYRDRQCETVSAHAAWSSGFYRQAKRFEGFPFWIARSGQGVTLQAVQESSAAPLDDICFGMTTRVQLSNEVRLVEEPCIIDNEICLREAIKHPNFDRPVAFLGGVEIAPLLAMAPRDTDVGHLLSIWSSRISVQQSGRIAAWLIQKRVYELFSYNHNM